MDSMVRVHDSEAILLGEALVTHDGPDIISCIEGILPQWGDDGQAYSIYRVDGSYVVVLGEYQDLHDLRIAGALFEGACERVSSGIIRGV